MSNVVALISVACLLIGLFWLSLPNTIDRAHREQANASSSASPVVGPRTGIEVKRGERRKSYVRWPIQLPTPTGVLPAGLEGGQS